MPMTRMTRSLIAKELEETTDDQGRTPLYLAAERGQIASMRALLEAGADISKLRPGSSGISALDLAARTEDRVGVLRLLIQHGVDVNAAGPESGATALHQAAFYNNAAGVDVLVESGAAVDWQDSRGWTPLHRACSGGCRQPVAALLRHGADIGKPDGTGLTPLHVAVAWLKHRKPVSSWNVHLGVVRELIERGADVNATGPCGSVLACAVIADDAAVVDLLVDAGANALDEDLHLGWTPLHVACVKGCSAAAIALLRRGADGRASDWVGCTPLHLAAGPRGRTAPKPSAVLNLDWSDSPTGERDLEILKALIQHGVDVNAVVETNGKSVLHHAVSSNSGEAIDLLVEAGATMDVQDSDGWTPLHAASIGGWCASTIALLKHGADPNTRSGTPSSTGFTPLQMAATSKLSHRFNMTAVGGHEGVMKALIKHGANVNATGPAGAALLMATMSNNAAAVDVLAEAGADVNALETNTKLTLLHVACSRDFLAAATAHLQCDADGDALDGGVPNFGEPIARKPKGDDVAVVECDSMALDSNPPPTSGNVEVVRALIRHGAAIDALTEDNAKSPLHYAALWNKPGAIDALVEAGATVDVQDCDGQTPLHDACTHDNCDSATALIKHGANLDMGDNEGRSSLFIAIYHGKLDTVNTLLAAGADVRGSPDGTCRPPLGLAAGNGHVEILKALTQHGADVNAPIIPDEPGTMALHRAAWIDRPDVIDALLEAGADVEARDDMGWTPLLNAIANGSFAATTALVRHGANVDAFDNAGNTCLHLAAAKSNCAVTKLLLAEGADASLYSDGDNSAMEFAAFTGNVAVLRVLLRHGVDVNASNEEGRTALHCAAQNNKSRAIYALVKAGALVDAQLNGSGCTPLHSACEGPNYDAVEALLKHGADVNSRGIAHNGSTPLHFIARRVGDDQAVEVAEILLRYGANESAVDMNSLTPADDAITRIGSSQGSPEEERFLELLLRAPADRAWRRRRLLVLYRACPSRVRLRRKQNVLVMRVTTRTRAKIARNIGGGAGASGGGSADCAAREQHGAAELREVTVRMAELPEQGLFRKIVGFL